jgi:hypothetical protein
VGASIPGHPLFMHNGTGSVAGQVLPEVSAEGDVHELEAPAHCEDRQTTGTRRPKQGELELSRRLSMAPVAPRKSPYAGSHPRRP